MTITKLEKITELGTLASLAVALGGKLLDSHMAVTAGTIATAICFPALIGSYIRGCYLYSKNLKSDYKNLRKEVIKRIGELKDEEEKSYFQNLVNGADKLGGYK